MSHAPDCVDGSKCGEPSHCPPDAVHDEMGSNPDCVKGQRQNRIKNETVLAQVAPNPSAMSRAEDGA